MPIQDKNRSKTTYPFFRRQPRNPDTVATTTVVSGSSGTNGLIFATINLGGAFVWGPSSADMFVLTGTNVRLDV